MAIGIYKITNPKGRVYIGQSVNINKRFTQYKRMQKCIKGQPKIYNSLIKYGTNNHIFQVLTECDISELNRLERYYQDLYNVIDNRSGLNCKLTETNDRVRVSCQETRSKLSKLNSDQVSNILNLLSEGVLMKDIADMYNVSRVIIRHIRQGKYFGCDDVKLKKLYDKNDIKVKNINSCVELLKNTSHLKTVEEICREIDLPIKTIKYLITKKKLITADRNHANWPVEVIRLLKDNYKHYGDEVLSKLINARFPKKGNWNKKHIETKRKSLNLKRSSDEIKKIRGFSSKRHLYRQLLKNIDAGMLAPIN